MRPAHWVSIARDGARGDVEEPCKVHRSDHGKVTGRVVGQGLADIHAGVIDQAVDPSEPLERLLYHATGRLGVCDIALHREEVGLVGGGDR